VVILIFVGSALLGRGLGAGEIARATAGWLAILLLLVGAYAYRTELTGVGGRLLSVMAPGVPISGRLAGEADSAVVIARGIDGHFAVRANVQNVPMMMMVDTGASFVTLTPEDAAAIGIDTRALRFTMPIRTANGLIQAAPITIAKLALGSIERRDVAALVAPPHSLDQSLLGMSFLNTLNAYAISGDRLVLTP
jgi:aspartyl protease family protein